MSDPAIAPANAPRRVLSGMRPTGKLHLGNYVGALQNWVRLQHEYECFFFIADWHALTTNYANPAQIKQNTVDVALDFLAAGLDPSLCTVFIQSHVPQHAELHLLLSMLTPLGWLERVPTYKEQLENLRGKDLATYGFLGYPLLQSADILLYQPMYVPVGADQVSHVELTREVARRFNSMYRSPILSEPEVLLTPTPKLPGIDGRKMSKSYRNTIGLSENPFTVSQKIIEMTTNGQRIEQSEPGDPDLCPVGDMHKVFSPPETLAWSQSGCRSASIPCKLCKVQASHFVLAVTQPIYKRRGELERDIDGTWAMLRAQAEKAAEAAEQTMISVRSAMNIAHDIGAIRQYIGLTEEQKHSLRDLGTTGLLALAGLQRDKEVRDYWRRNILPYDISLANEANRHSASLVREMEEPLLTARQKRVLLAPVHPSPSGPGRWTFDVPPGSYEVWVLLLIDEQGVLHDFVIPQRYFAQSFAQWKRERKIRKGGDPAFGSAGEHRMHSLTLEKSGDQFALCGLAAGELSLAELYANYQPLQ